MSPLRFPREPFLRAKAEGPREAQTSREDGRRLGTGPNGANLRTIWDDTVLCKSPSMVAWQRLTPPVEPKAAQPSWL
jgi:hypothetical protein